jgi:hypothetical protein
MVMLFRETALSFFGFRSRGPSAHFETVEAGGMYNIRCDELRARDIPYDKKSGHKCCLYNRIRAHSPLAVLV